MALIPPVNIEDLSGHPREIAESGCEQYGRVLKEVLADRYGASRLPVRYALGALEGEGLVTLVLCA